MSKKKAYWRLLLGRIYRCIFTYLLQPFATLFSAVLLFLAPTAKNLRKQDDDLKSITLHATSIHNVCHYNSSTPHQISLSSPHNRSDINLRSNSRKQLSSTPPGANVISRTSSRHSKSSSDGSFDTPAPSTPPHNNSGLRHSKPPNARNASVTKSRRKSGDREDKLVEDLSEAFYAKSWMCGFADAFNF